MRCCELCERHRPAVLLVTRPAPPPPAIPITAGTSRPRLSHRHGPAGGRTARTRFLAGQERNDEDDELSRRINANLLVSIHPVVRVGFVSEIVAGEEFTAKPNVRVA
jgi:hypothetical protein